MVDAPNAQNSPLSAEELAAKAPAWRAAYAEMLACRELFEQLWVCKDEKKAVLAALFVSERLPGVVSRWRRAC